MRPVLTADQMRAADRRTIDEIGLPGAVLMENAGAAVAAAVNQAFPSARRVVAVCGLGNNGGDGLVAARRLRERGVLAILLGPRDRVRGDARLHLEAYERGGGPLIVTEAEAGSPGEWTEALATADVLIDAVLGTGLRREPEGLAAEAIEHLRRAFGRGVPIVAVDLPSGVPSDGGDVPWPAVVASWTVTFAAPKLGHVFPPACDHMGRLTIADIGIPDSVLSGADHALWLLESSDAAAAFGPRPRDAHKGHFGHVLVVGGSVGKSGAAVLAARAALRSGAGLVTVATPDGVSATVAAGVPEAMTEGLSSTSGGGIDRAALDRALALAEARDAAVIGPGLGTDESTWTFVREFVARCPVPLLVDADGLNALAAAGTGRSLRAGPGRPVILTPHPGEMSRLTGRSVAEVQAGRLEAASRLARETGAFVVLKGQRTLVAEPSGRVAVNPTGNPGMATGGTGDVLSGIGGALLARLDAWPAATAAVFVHGLAGDLAAAQKGEHSLIAGDVIDALPEAIRSLGAVKTA